MWIFGVWEDSIVGKCIGCLVRGFEFEFSGFIEKLSMVYFFVILVLGNREGLISRSLIVG